MRPQKAHFERDLSHPDSSNLVLGTEKDAITAKKRIFSTLKNKQCVKQCVRRKRFMAPHIPYKLPSICRCKSGVWFVEYFYEYPDRPGKFKSFKVKDGINRIHDPQEKEEAAQQLAKDIRRALQVYNYNPFEEEKSRIRVAAAAIEKNSGWRLSQGIREFRAYLKKQNYSPRTIRTYNNYLLNLQTHLEENPESDIPAADFSETDLVRLLDAQSDKLGWSARTYNNYLDFYGTFFNRLQKLERMVRRKTTYNIDTTTVDAKITTPQRNKAYSKAIRIKIKQQAEKRGYLNLKDFLEWIYLSSMRPAEVRELRFKELDTNLRQIRIIGKTGDRLIPISDQLLALIEKRSEGVTDHHFHVFGMAGKPGPHRMSTDYFPTQFAAIKKELNLSSQYTIYSMKASGIQDMIKAGFKDEEIRMLTGHKTQAAFEAYKRDLVIDNSHVMKGSVIEF